MKLRTFYYLKEKLQLRYRQRAYAIQDLATTAVEPLRTHYGFRIPYFQSPDAPREAVMTGP